MTARTGRKHGRVASDEGLSATLSLQFAVSRVTAYTFLDLILHTAPARITCSPTLFVPSYRRMLKDQLLPTSILMLTVTRLVVLTLVEPGITDGIAPSLRGKL